jgi:hypothetical protein
MERGSKPNVFKRTVAALAATAAMLGSAGCSAIHVFDENYMPACPKGVETVTVEEARKAYANPDSSVKLSKNDERLPSQIFADAITLMDCRDKDGNQMVIRIKAELNGAVFQEDTRPYDSRLN